MYLVPIHIPIAVRGERCFVGTEWRRSLLLLRDSLAGRFGDIVLAAPRRELVDDEGEQLMEELPGDDGIVARPAPVELARSRQFWQKDRRTWLNFLRPLVTSAEVVHAGLDDLFRPFTYSAYLSAVHHCRPTVFVQDTDTVTQIQQMAAGRGAAERVKWAIYRAALERCCRYGVAKADLALLKGRSLVDRYSRFGRNVRLFHDTSYHSSDIVSESDVLARLRERKPDSLRLVYCGRLEPRKGVHQSLEIVAAARRAGLDVRFDVIGGGIEAHALTDQSQRLGVQEAVCFLGRLPYGPGLIQRLSRYDALLFTPTVEDTPRMIFDAYAAGLPMLASGVPYTRERAEEDRTVVLLEDQPALAAKQLAALASTPAKLRDLTSAALAAAHDHAADRWYGRRAQWTFEAVERRRAADGH